MTDNIQPPVDGLVKVDPARPKQSHLFHVSQTLDESRTLNPSPVYISLGLEPSAFPAELGGFRDGASPFAQPKSVSELVFHNDDPRAARSVPIREMDSLLEASIIDPAARARIAATVIDVLSNVVDRVGQTRGLLVPVLAGGGRFQVDPGPGDGHDKGPQPSVSAGQGPLTRRGGGIRTHDLFVPNEARYQAAPHPDEASSA